MTKISIIAPSSNSRICSTKLGHYFARNLPQTRDGPMIHNTNYTHTRCLDTHVKWMTGCSSAYKSQVEVQGIRPPPLKDNEHKTCINSGDTFISYCRLYPTASTVVVYDKFPFNPFSSVTTEIDLVNNAHYLTLFAEIKRIIAQKQLRSKNRAFVLQPLEWRT